VGRPATMIAELTPLITHVLPLTELRHAAELARTGACGKVVLLPPTALDAGAAQ